MLPVSELILYSCLDFLCNIDLILVVLLLVYNNGLLIKFAFVPLDPKYCRIIVIENFSHPDFFVIPEDKI